jgi:hypothetical protein
MPYFTMKTFEMIGLGRNSLRTVTSLALIAAGLLCGAHRAQAGMAAGLSAYDAAITGDTTPALARLTSLITFDGTAGAPFDLDPLPGTPRWSSSWLAILC